MAAEFGLYGGMEVTDEVFESPASIVFDRRKPDAHHKSCYGRCISKITLPGGAQVAPGSDHLRF